MPPTRKIAMGVGAVLLVIASYVAGMLLATSGVSSMIIAIPVAIIALLFGGAFYFMKGGAGVERAGIVAFLLILITLPLYTGFILNSPMGGSDITWLAVVAILLLFLFGRPLMKGVRRLL